MARLRHRNGSVVVVADEMVQALVGNGFTKEQEKATTKTTRKGSSRKTEK